MLLRLERWCRSSTSCWEASTRSSAIFNHSKCRLSMRRLDTWSRQGENSIIVLIVVFWSALAFAWELRRNVFILIILPSTDQQQQEALIEKYMQLPNAVWDDIINQVAFSKLILFYFDLILFSKLLLFFFDKRILFWWFFIPGEQERWRFERPRGSKTVGKHSQGIDF